MINQSDVSFSRVYFLDPPTWQTANTAAQLRLETENVKAKGLGLPLPSGAISTSETLDGAPLFTGEAALRDYAVGDEIWYAVGSAAMVRGKVTVQRNDSSETSFRAEISNAYSDPVPIELALPSKPIDKADGLAMRNGRWTIRAIAPANESLIIEYRIR